MQTTIQISLEQLPAYYRQLGPKMHRAVKRGLIRGGLRAVDTLVRATSVAPPANPQQVGVGGAVNTGYYKRAWKSYPVPEGVLITNSANYAAVIEHGRRVNAKFPPLYAIRDWARRRLRLSKEEAARAAYPIARKIALRGLLPREVMTRKQPKIHADAWTEILAELNKAMKGTP